MKFYELSPIDGRNSFYGKALVEIAKNGTETLYNYGTPIIKRIKNSGRLVRLYDGWTMTTGRHIKAFCGLDKKAFMAMKVERR
jgi:hypothetical protein